MMKKHTLYLDEQAKQDAALIQKRFGLQSLAAAVRYALRDLAERIEREGVVGSVVGSVAKKE